MLAFLFNVSMVDDSSTDELIRWSKGGNSFIGTFEKNQCTEGDLGEEG
jgi:hypothetical protein